jgi:hypothetical protein
MNIMAMTVIGRFFSWEELLTVPSWHIFQMDLGFGLTDNYGKMLVRQQQPDEWL